MRHRIRGRKFNRTTAHREAMLRNLVQNLFEHGRITTTVPKAKEARWLAERCITYAKKGNAALAAVEDQIPPLRQEVEALKQKLVTTSDDKERFQLRWEIDRTGRKIADLRAKGEHFRRLALKRLHRKGIVRHLFEEVAPRYTERDGGYTRILKAGYRKGDNAPIALFELV